MKLCLGTAQFGMKYGIRAQKQPSVKEAIKMLDYATQNDIDSIDTAAAYGTSEDIIGEFLRKKTIARDKLFIISKFTPNKLDNVETADYKKVICEQLEESLKRLHTNYLDSYLLHSSRYVFNDEIIGVFYEIKREGKIKHCGVSVYNSEEAKACLYSDKIDFMQLPFSIFDQRMLKEGVFNSSHELKNTQIHSRSAFLQGLILMKEEEVPSFLSAAKPIIRKMDLLCKELNLSRIKLGLLFVKQFKAISHLVFGVDNIDQLKEDIEVFSQDFSNKILNDIAGRFSDIDTSIVIPSLWQKK